MSICQRYVELHADNERKQMLTLGVSVAARSIQQIWEGGLLMLFELSSFSCYAYLQVSSSSKLECDF